MPPAATKIQTLDTPVILLSVLPLDHARGGNSQELLSSAVPEQASNVPRGAASVQASNVTFGRLTKKGE